MLPDWTVIRAWLTAIGLSMTLGSGCLMTGCSDDARKLEQELKVADRLIEYGERHNVAYSVHVHSDGYPRFQQQAAVGIDTGIRVSAEFHGNAANSRLDPTPKPLTPVTFNGTDSAKMTDVSANGDAADSPPAN